MRKTICKRRKFRYIKTQISVGWHLPNSAGVSFKTHIVFKKNRSAKTQKQRMRPALPLQIFSKKGLDTRIPKRLICECFPHQLMGVKMHSKLFHRSLVKRKWKITVNLNGFTDLCSQPLSPASSHSHPLPPIFQQKQPTPTHFLTKGTYYHPFFNKHNPLPPILKKGDPLPSHFSRKTTHSQSFFDKNGPLSYFDNKDPISPIF